MKNLLLQPVEYKIEKTAWGTWRRHLSEQGRYYSEFTSHMELLGLPLLHYTRGINPQMGGRKTARGVIAVGRVAVGGIAIGQAAFGLCAIGQAGFGLLFGLGQACSGLYAVGQLAIGGWFGAGQLASGYTAIGQLAIGEYVLAQLGIGNHLWTPEQSDPAAVAHFTALWDRARALF